jgi:hypothetical protein
VNPRLLGSSRNSTVRAIAGKAPRHPWHRWHSRGDEICNLLILKELAGFEPHPLRHPSPNARFARGSGWLRRQTCTRKPDPCPDAVSTRKTERRARSKTSRSTCGAGGMPVSGPGVASPPSTPARYDGCQGVVRRRGQWGYQEQRERGDHDPALRHGTAPVEISSAEGGAFKDGVWPRRFRAHGATVTRRPRCRGLRDGAP